MTKRLLQLALVTTLAIMPACPAMAYVGPGAGLGMLGSLLAVIGALALAILGLFVLPFRMLMKSRKAKTAAAHQAAPAPQSQDR